MGTAPAGAGSVQVMLPDPLSISIPLRRSPLRSSTVFHVPPCTLMYHV